MQKIKHPKIYFKTDDPLQISFVKSRGYRVATPSSDCVFMAYQFDSADQVEGARRLLEVCRDTYCIAWDLGAHVLAYTDRDMDGQYWGDLTSPQQT